MPYGIRPDENAKDVQDMVGRTWKKRFENIRAQMMYLSAKQTKDSIFTKLRSSKDDKEYREGIDIAQVKGVGKGEAAFSVALLGKKKAARIDPTRVLIYIGMTRRLSRSAPEVAVLVKFNPWTVESLPFTPSRNKATITYRKANTREVTEVTKKRNNDQRVWSRLLTKAGLRQNRNEKNDRKAMGAAKGMSDLSFSGFRTEWGQGGTQPKPHWRPAIRDLKQNGIKRMMKNREFVRAAIDPGYKGWLRWPTKTRKTISVSVARTFEAFQKKLKV